MGFLGLFRSKSFHPEEFEQQLTALTQAISQTKEQITALSAKQKTWRRSLCLYCVVIYLSYVAFRYKTSLNNLGAYARGKSRLMVFVSGQTRSELAAIILLPVAMALVVYVMNALFTVLIRSKNRNLRGLLQKHKAKLDELKDVTNFSRTNQILKKFDTKPGSETIVQTSTNHKNGSQNLQNLQNKQSQQPPKGQYNLPNSGSHQVKKSLPPTVNIPNKTPPQSEPTKHIGKEKPPAKNDALKAHQQAFQPGPAKLSFQDRLLDFIIGSDHNENVENRYALICANCYTHNGLAPPGCENPNSVTYICRQCGYINGAIGAKGMGDACPIVPESAMNSVSGNDSNAGAPGTPGTPGNASRLETSPIDLKADLGLESESQELKSGSDKVEESTSSEKTKND